MMTLAQVLNLQDWPALGRDYVSDGKTFPPLEGKTVKIEGPKGQAFRILKSLVNPGAFSMGWIAEARVSEEDERTPAALFTKSGRESEFRFRLISSILDEIILACDQELAAGAEMSKNIPNVHSLLLQLLKSVEYESIIENPYDENIEMGQDLLVKHIQAIAKDCGYSTGGFGAGHDSNQKAVHYRIRLLRDQMVKEDADMGLASEGVAKMLGSGDFDHHDLAINDELLDPREIATNQDPRDLATNDRSTDAKANERQADVKMGNPGYLSFELRTLLWLIKKWRFSPGGRPMRVLLKAYKKSSDHGYVATIQKELEMSQKLSNLWRSRAPPNLARVLHVCPQATVCKEGGEKCGSIVCVISELVEGKDEEHGAKDLFDWLYAHPNAGEVCAIEEEGVARFFFKQFMEGVSEMHKAQVFHNDLKVRLL